LESSTRRIFLGVIRFLDFLNNVLETHTAAGRPRRRTLGRKSQI
jgi:hypothetical protein